jgi:hypothetical protein
MGENFWRHRIQQKPEYLLIPREPSGVLGIHDDDLLVVLVFNLHCLRRCLIRALDKIKDSRIPQGWKHESVPWDEVVARQHLCRG